MAKKPKHEEVYEEKALPVQKVAEKAVEPSGQHGIQSIKAVLELAIKLGQAVDTSLQNNKLDITDLQHFFGIVGSVAPAFEGFKSLKKELHDLDATEQEELALWVQENFNIADDKIEQAVENGLNLVGQLFLFVKSLK